MSDLEIKVPDIGDFSGVEVIEIHVEVGDTVAEEDTLISLETEKATMDIPAPSAGVVAELKVKVGEEVSQGHVILTLRGEAGASEAPVEKAVEKAAPAEVPASAPSPEKQTSAKPPHALEAYRDEPVTSQEGIHAGPATRRLARELGVDLKKVPGTGRKGRLTKEDLQAFVKGAMASGNSSSLGVEPAPAIDFSQFGEVDTKPLSRINKRSARNLHRNWVSIPHVTQFDEADITELEAFRKENKEFAAQQGVKLTPLVFLMKASVSALRQFPRFNTSLSPDGENLIQKHYYHIGVAVDTPNGLVVPVVRNVDAKSIFQLAKELSELSALAREGKLRADQMQGSSFTISSLGGVGGTAFTPIINAPDVAILGVSRSSLKPIYQDEQWVPRLRLPLSLSYDHRVVDGALAARFTTYLVEILSDLRKLLLT